jgi:mannan endo-1,6-alpha-mannosidase
MTATAVLVPSLKTDILNLLTPSAQAAAAACSGGTGGTQCGTKWYVGGYDGVTGVGQEMSALEAVLGLLI